MIKALIIIGIIFLGVVFALCIALPVVLTLVLFAKTYNHIKTKRNGNGRT